MCDKSVENDLKVLKFVPDYFKIQEMCEKAVIQSLSAIVYVPVSAKNSTYVWKVYFKKSWNAAIYP